MIRSDKCKLIIYELVSGDGEQRGREDLKVLEMLNT
jgi:hypothetical protein